MLIEALNLVLQANVILYILLGVAGGICIGCLPGLTTTMGVALVLPLTFGMDAVPSILLLIGVYIGAVLTDPLIFCLAQRCVLIADIPILPTDIGIH